MAPSRHVPVDSHRFEVIEDKLLEEDTTCEPWTAYVTQLIVSDTFLQDEVVQEDILEEAKEAAV